MRLSARKVTVDVRRIGYAPRALKLESGGDTTLVVEMTPLARELAPVTIKAEQAVRALELRGFYRRIGDRAKGVLNGEFISLEDIERRKPHRITMMLDGVQGVRVVYGRRHTLDWAVLGPGGCVMTVILDGVRLNALGSPTNFMTNTVDELVTPTAVAGIEVYRSAGRAPPEYQSMAGNCGIVLIWTR